MLLVQTLEEEFVTECGFTKKAFNLVNFYAGTPTVEARTITPGAKITVVPILGLCALQPEVVVNRDELASFKWIGLQAIKHTERLARGYRRITLPAALGAIGLRGAALAKLLD